MAAGQETLARSAELNRQLHMRVYRPSGRIQSSLRSRLPLWNVAAICRSPNDTVRHGHSNRVSVRKRQRSHGCMEQGPESLRVRSKVLVWVTFEGARPASHLDQNIDCAYSVCDEGHIANSIGDDMDSHWPLDGKGRDQGQGPLFAEAFHYNGAFSFHAAELHPFVQRAVSANVRY